MKQTVMVLGTKEYQTEYEGKEYEGVRVSYILEEPSADDNVQGFFPAENKFPYEMRRKIKEVPGIYDFEARMENVKGKTVLVFTDLEFVRSVEMPWI